MVYIKLIMVLLAANISASASADVFISEYIEGAGNNKAIELYNSGKQTLCLQDYTLEIYFNGNSHAGTTIYLSGNIASKHTYVIGHSLADSVILSVSDITDNIEFNGDDTLILRNNAGDIIDVFGQKGFDPGGAFSQNGVSSKDSTLRRKETILEGDTNEADEFFVGQDYYRFAKDEFDGLGRHFTKVNKPIVPIDPPANPIPIDPPVDPIVAPTGKLVSPCVNCPNLSPVADPNIFDASNFYALVKFAIANLSATPSRYEKAQVKALISDSARANQINLSYAEVWSALTATDEDSQDTEKIVLFYSNRSINKFRNGSGAASNNQDNWNREHTWPKSHGFLSISQDAYTDLHHLRPTDISVNSTRGNKDFDYSDDPVDEAPGSRSDADSFEPRNEIKGDLARMMFYMDTRYEGMTGENTPDLVLVDRITRTTEQSLGKLCVLLKWHLDDPISQDEIVRHNRVYQFQGNRNPYVDNPEWIDTVYSRATCNSDLGSDAQ